MTNTDMVECKSAESHAQQGNIFFKNVDIMSIDCLTFAVVRAYFINTSL
jgi:hypothetical protein